MKFEELDTEILHEEIVWQEINKELKESRKSTFVDFLEASKYRVPDKGEDMKIPSIENFVVNFDD